MKKKSTEIRSQFVIELKYKKGCKETHTVYAKDAMEAYEWGEKQVEELGFPAKISVLSTETKD